MESGLRILFADPSPAVLRVVGAMLETLGVAHTTLVRSGSEALEQLLANPRRFDGVIADATMPNGSGLQLLQSIRCGEVNGSRPDMCYVLTAGDVDDQVVTVARILDVNGFLLKPFSTQMLDAEIGKARQRVPRLDFARYRSVSTDPASLGARQPLAT